MLRRFLVDLFIRYETQKMVQIRSWKIGLMFRCTQLSIILYIGMWVMWRGRGYQAVDTAMSGVTAKLKGIAFANLSHVAGIGAAFVWDVADYVVPPQQNSAFFVLTNLVMTRNQSQRACPESWEITPDNISQCRTDRDCLRGEVDMRGSGVKTGRCVETFRDSEKKRVCEIYGWCPTEDDRMPLPGKALLSQVVNFTVLIKNNIEFPRYHVKRRNILKWMDKRYLATCRYNPYHVNDSFCPIFQLGDILRYSDAKSTNIWVHGGFVSIHITWNCDLDWSVEKCVPKYTFRRLDDEKSPIGKGWNFRFGHIYYENQEKKRTLVKAYGVQFFITVEGKGRKFDAFTFTMNLGSGLALLGMATFLCDVIALNLTRKRHLYRQAKVYVVPASCLSISDKESLSIQECQHKISPPTMRKKKRIRVALNGGHKKFRCVAHVQKTSSPQQRSPASTNITPLPSRFHKASQIPPDSFSDLPEEEITLWSPNPHSEDQEWYYLKPSRLHRGRLLDVYVADSLPPLPVMPGEDQNPIRKLSQRSDIFV